MEESKLVDVGARLREERDRLQLRQGDLAEALGCSKTTQSNYEQGHRAPDALYLSRAARLGFDVGYVVTGEPSAGYGFRDAQGDLTSMTTEEAYLLRNYRATDDEGRAEVLGASAVEVDRAKRRAQKSPPPAKT